MKNLTAEKKSDISELKAVENEIEKVASQIARLVSQMVDLYRKRAGISEALGLPVINREREALFIDRVRILLGNQFGLPREFLGRLFKLVGDECNRRLL